MNPSNNEQMNNETPYTDITSVKHNTTRNISLKYKDISDRIQKMGVAYMMLSETLQSPNSHIAVEFEAIGISLIRDCVFHEAMSFSDEERVLFRVLSVLDTADRFMRAVHALSKISPMNFILIHKELLSNKNRITSQLEYLRTKRGSAGLYSSMKYEEQVSITDKLEDLLLIKNDFGDVTQYEYPKHKPEVSEKDDVENTVPPKKLLKVDRLFEVVTPQHESSVREEIASVVVPATLQNITGKSNPTSVLRRQLVLDYIKTKEMVTLADLHGDMPHINTKTLSRDLSEMVKEGLLISHKNGRIVSYWFNKAA